MLSVENNVDLEMTMSYQLGPVPWTLAAADGCPVKSDKPKLLQNLEALVDPSNKPPAEKSIYVHDVNVIFQALTAVPEKCEGLAGKILLKLCFAVD